MAKRKYHRNQRRDQHQAQHQDSDANRTPDGGKRKAARGGNSGRVWLFGTHAVMAAIENPVRTCIRLLVTPEARTGADAALQRASAAGLGRPSAAIVERSALNQQLPEGAVHQGLALEVEALPEVFIEDVLHDLKDVSPALVVVIDQGTDPRNVGAVMRSAAAFGACAVVLQDRHSPAATGHMAKAASGALETVPLIRVTNLSRALEQLKESGFWCVGLDGQANDNTHNLDWPARCVLVLGSEGAGMRRLVRENCDFLARISMTENMESLNLSNAAAIALYEIHRQKSKET